MCIKIYWNTGLITKAFEDRHAVVPMVGQSSQKARTFISLMNFILCNNIL